MLSFVLAATAAASLASALDCSVADYSKVDCGFSGITQAGCESKGCCWKEASSGGTPWCFYEAGSDVSSCYGFQDKMELPFSNDEVSTMRKYFMSNINIEGKGGIVAAPDQQTPGGSYYYHWMRDGALTMRCLQETNPGNFSAIEDTVKAYVQWVVKVQSEADPNGIDVRTEPKFMLPDGEVFTDGWCRPQNDGPGLRATSLMIAAQSLIAAGQMDYVKEYMWTGDSSKLNGGAIKYDLDYVVDGYTTNTCDLWEEIRDPDLFWNRATMKKAMYMGADFAESVMGDSSAADTYRATMAKISAALYDSHYNGEFVQECNSRTRDTAVIVGFNDAFIPDMEKEDVFAPTSIEVAQTVGSYNGLFCAEYAINAQDTDAGLPGVLYGRYGGDSYAGGNPWVLSTAALASLMYRAAAYVVEFGAPSSDALAVWKDALNVPDEVAKRVAPHCGKGKSSESAELAEIFAAQGDGVLLRLRAHVERDGFHLDEQIDRNTGEQMSAENLTWSYAEVLNAMYYRSLYETAAAKAASGSSAV